MKTNRILLTICFLLFTGMVFAQSTKKRDNAVQWVKVSDDGEVEIYYDPKITTDKKGQHIVWVKAVYHSPEWQNYFANQIGKRTPVVSTKTKAMFDERYNYVMVRQVQCFSKAGKKIFDTGDDRSAGWGVVNASDPVGIVGEYLGNQNEY